MEETERKFKNVSFYLNDNNFEFIDKIQKKNLIKRSSFINMLIETYGEQLLEGILKR
jgi:hypothetical protein